MFSVNLFMACNVKHLPHLMPYHRLAVIKIDHAGHGKILVKNSQNWYFLMWLRCHFTTFALPIPELPLLLFGRIPSPFEAPRDI